MDELAKRLKIKLFRTSVKENFNVDQGMNEYCTAQGLWGKDPLCYLGLFRSYVYFFKRHDFFHTCTNPLVCYAVFEYLAVKCIEQRAKEATQRAQKTEATTIGK